MRPNKPKVAGPYLDSAENKPNELSPIKSTQNCLSEKIGQPQSYLKGTPDWIKVGNRKTTDINKYIRATRFFLRIYLQ